MSYFKGVQTVQTPKRPFPALRNQLYLFKLFFFLGKDLLVKPVTTQGQNSIDVYLPGKDEVSNPDPNPTRICGCKCSLHLNFLTH